MINQDRCQIARQILEELNGIEEISIRETIIKIEFRKWKYLVPKVRWRIWQAFQIFLAVKS